MEESDRLPEQFVPRGRRGPVAAPARQPVTSRARSASVPASRRLKAGQVAAIRDAMQVLVKEDLAKGVSQDNRLYCDACEQVQPAAGFIQYDRYAVCNRCAIEYEIAHARGIADTAGQYVRDKHFGESGLYALDAH